METYPYPTPNGILDLVRKSEFDRLKWELEEQQAKYTDDVAELNERLTKQQSDMLDTIVGLRSELTRYSAEREHNANMAGMWQDLAERLAEALNHCGHAAYCESVMWFPGKCTCGKADALAAYESVIATTGKPGTAQ